MPYRQVFRAMFPEVPHTNKKLEWQQATLLKQQEDTLRGLKFQSTSANVRYDSQDRKKWLEMYPWTPNITVRFCELN
ncbi:hypothetical protein SNE40_018128 [Patella caerulea]|uniref:Centrosome and spindle pole-associated protein 1 C-terminal domain-containing protein n=1 Tax=Patella caerulea TaxID=87958 RepID=A0AAN8PGK8_PATCE